MCRRSGGRSTSSASAAPPADWVYNPYALADAWHTALVHHPGSNIQVVHTILESPKIGALIRFVEMD